MLMNSLLYLICSFLCLNYVSAQTTFQEKAQAVGIQHYYHNENLMGGGIAVFDFDQDGWEDIWINGGSNQDALYRNKGDGTFEEIGQQAGIAITADYATTGVVTGDIDNDGFREVFITTRDEQSNLLFYNNGDGTFRNITHVAGLSDDIAWSTTASFGDLNQDGYLDLYVGNYVEDFEYVVDTRLQKIVGYQHTCQPNFLYLNNQDGTFTEVSQQMQADDMGCALASAFTDFDNDNDSDIMVINDYGQWVSPNQLLINRQESMLTVGDTSAAVGIYAMGLAIGDYDQDGHLDYYITNIGNNALLNNQGNGVFLDKAKEANVADSAAQKDLTVGWGTAFLDVDNDTDLDLLVANGFITTLSFNPAGLINEDRLFINTLANPPTITNLLIFEEQAISSGLGDSGQARGLAYGDFDKDGDIDFVVLRVSGTHNLTYRQNILYYENQLANNSNWLVVQLIGAESNRDAYGAHVNIFVNGRSWVAEINGGSSHASQHTSRLHFGLGEATIVDSLIIDWPMGQQQIITDIPANQEIIIAENDNSTTNIFSANLELSLNLQVYPNPFTQSAVITFHKTPKQPLLFTLLNGQGQVLRSQKITTQFILERQQLTAGIYWVKISTANGQYDAFKITIL